MPYHAAEDHLEFLATLFPDAEGISDFPLFPSETGDFVHENKMLALVEAIAVRVGEPLVTKAGTNRFGKHSWRATGAVYLTSLRMELFRIQLMARWSSPVIMRYARLSPLTDITDHVKELQVSNNLAKIVDRIRKDVKGMSKQLEDMDMTTRKLLEIEAKVADMQEIVDESNKDPPFVINEDTGCCHKILLKSGPPVDWATVCTFRFGLVRHRLVHAPPASGTKSVCHRCFPKLRAERKLEAAS